ncbi:MAG: DUF3341 domain-containing protein [Thermoanaerobaculia bacterium]|nr:MAG: DUF3341 domain-containing protein [Thermoanaerobaculia bacterium]
MHAETGTPEIHGLLAEYRSAQALLDATRRAHTEGFRAMDAYTPYPVEEIAEIVCDHHRSKVPLICLVGGVAGALAGWALAWWTSTVSYPLNIGGKPFNSWPAFIPVIFETTILFAAFSAGIGMLALNRLPEPYHPVFNVAGFRERGSREGYFLCIEAGDARFDRVRTREFLAATGALEVHEVEP